MMLFISLCFPHESYCVYHSLGETCILGTGPQGLEVPTDLPSPFCWSLPLFSPPPSPSSLLVSHSFLSPLSSSLFCCCCLTGCFWNEWCFQAWPGIHPAFPSPTPILTVLGAVCGKLGQTMGQWVHFRAHKSPIAL